ncbi:MAG: TRAP-type transport system periplasmic protein [Thermoanaerobacterium sp.]|jgi:tripartite ATP-independent transporter DctP family solute receptor|nr:TRAP-type transport system periplasmic protein [Thermoanaerobacterium sp.]MDK2822045.1 TRAP-type transport system periplasmic protein [Clostridia bacterium]
MKKLVTMLLISALIISLVVGCGQQKASNESSSGQQQKEEKPIEITFAIHTPPGTIENQAAEMFKKIVEEKTNNAITVKLYPGAVLGGEKDNIEQIKTGEIQMSIFGDILTSIFAPEYDPTVIPFIFPDIESVYKYWNGPFGEKIKQALEQRGNVILIGLEKRGARNLTTNKEIKKPEDLKGLKIRVPEIPTWVTVWKSLGTLPTSIAWNEVYSALQTKVVDAQENPYENIYSAKLYEVQKYTIKTEHLFNMFHWVVNKDFFNNLKPEYQQIILDAVKEATKWGDDQIEKKEEELEQKLKEAGMKIIEVDKEAFRKAAIPGIKEVAKGWAPGVWDEIKGYIGE